MTQRQTFFAGFALSSLAFAYGIIGISTTEWVVEDALVPYDTVHLLYGLFKKCLGDTCECISNPPSIMFVVRGLEIIGVLFNAGGISLVVAYWLRTMPVKSTIPLHYLGAVAQLLGGVCTTLGAAVFSFHAEEMNFGTPLNWNFGSSFYWSVAAGIMAVLGGSLLTLTASKLVRMQEKPMKINLM